MACTKKQKSAYGCYTEKKKKIVWTHEQCPFCLGAVKKCFYCGGKNEIPFKRCVHKSVGKNTSRVLNHYIEYRQFGNYPNGKGRLYQPIQLLLVFSILEKLFFLMEEQKTKD